MGPGRHALRIMLVGLVLLGGFAALGAASILTWEYTNSSEFCGTTCHGVHPEEAVAYSHSPHSRVKCVECHIGRLGTLDAILIKATHMAHAWHMLVGYERPLTSPSMGTSSDSCERCHAPELFQADTLRVLKHYAADEASTETQVHLRMHIGGGIVPGRETPGIHWHIANQVRFMSTDAQRQDIPWVEVTYANSGGRTEVYTDVESEPLTAEMVSQAEKHVMDCLDCHNRTGHAFRNPEEELNEALAQGSLDRRLPYVKASAMALLNQTYATEEGAARLVEMARADYEQNYPWVAAKYPEAIAKAESFMKGLQSQYMTDLMDRHRFDEAGLSWRSFPDDEGHKNFPGCFRCHDGKHKTADGEPIRLHCNLCHTIPVVLKEGEPSPPLPDLNRLPQPPSHLAADFMSVHKTHLDATCQACHGEISFGYDGGSFCANPACHGRQWPNLSLNRPPMEAQNSFRPTDFRKKNLE